MSENPFIERDGKRYARVTSVLSPLSDFSRINPDVLERKRVIGTDTHAAINSTIQNEFYLPNPESVPYYSSFLLWREALDPTFEASEQRYFSDELRITGQIDAIAILPDGNRTLIDFKTSASENSIVWPRQAHLYYHLLKANDVDISDRFLFIKLDKYGSLPIVYTYRFQESILNDCLEMVDIFWAAHSDDLSS